MFNVFHIYFGICIFQRLRLLEAEVESLRDQLVDRATVARHEDELEHRKKEVWYLC